MRQSAWIALTLSVAAGAVPAAAQRAAGTKGPGDPMATRLAVVLAEDRRAPTPRDLATLRSASNSGDDQAARMAVRALGRLERPELLSDILPALKHPVPEIRAEAANALAQAAQGWVHQPPARTARTAGDAVVATLTSRLSADPDANVRAAVAESIGRWPYASSAQIEKADKTLVDFLERASSLAERLGAVRALEALARTALKLDAVTAIEPAVLRETALLRSAAAPQQSIVLASRTTETPGTSADPARDARIRRLAIEALIVSRAVNDDVVSGASGDADAQVRRLAMRAIAAGSGVSPRISDEVLQRGLTDPSPMVRIEIGRAHV